MEAEAKDWQGKKVYMKSDMKNRPITFTPSEIRARLSGQTEIRRVIEPQPDWSGGFLLPWLLRRLKCPYGVSGDRFWVQEEWRVGTWSEDEGCIAVDYRADNSCRKEWIAVEDEELFTDLWQESSDDAWKVFGEQDRYEWQTGQSPCRWRPAESMPREFSRIAGEIVDIRVERAENMNIDGIQNPWLWVVETKSKEKSRANWI